MLDLAFVLLLILWAAGVGLRVLARLAPVPEHPADAMALAVPLGLGALALAALGLAELGALNPAGLAAVLAVGAGLGGRRGLDAAARLVGRPEPAGLAGGAFDLALAATIVGTLLTALAPVTDGDALCYHLQVPKVFLARGAALFEPDLHETVYPLVTEMLYAVALAFRGPVACRLIQWALGLAFAANVTALARPVLGSRARWAGTIALLVPAVSNGMSAPLNDVALAAFGNAALFAWFCWRERPSPGAAALAGILAGMAMGVKYPALIWAGLLGLLLATSWIPQRIRISNLKFQIPNPELSPRARVGSGAAFAAAAILVGGGWYLRAFLHTGNPVYPFFRHAFGGAGIDDVLDPIKRPMAVTVGNLLTALGPLTLQPDRFDSLSHQLGPAFLLFLPGMLLLRAPRRVWGMVAFGFAFLALCLTQRQSMRFVLIAVGPWSVGVAWLAAAWRERRSLPGGVLVAALVLILGFEATLALARARHGLTVVLGRESAESYLMRREPTYRVGRWVGGHLPAEARLVGQDHRGFYIPRPYTMELAHRRRTGLGTRGESAEEIVWHLRDQGFTHLLLCPPVPETAVEFDPTLGRRLAPWLEGRRPVYHEDVVDPDGVVRRYAIYDLSAGEALADGGRARR
jgi:hypothetical protein